MAILALLWTKLLALAVQVFSDTTMEHCLVMLAPDTKWIWLIFTTNSSRPQLSKLMSSKVCMGEWRNSDCPKLPSAYFLWIFYCLFRTTKSPGKWDQFSWRDKVGAKNEIWYIFEQTCSYVGLAMPIQGK